MTSLKTFTITWDEFVSLAFQLAFLIESHKPMCHWLGPYEENENTCSIARLYRTIFEGKLSSLLISLAANLRILEDRGIISGALVGTPEAIKIDPKASRVYQNGVGRIRRDSSDWEDLQTLRDLLNTIMHSERIDFAVSVIEEHETGRKVMGFDDIVVVSEAKQKGKGQKTVELRLQNFSRYLFDIVEEMQPTFSMSTETE